MTFLRLNKCSTKANTIGSLSVWHVGREGSREQGEKQQIRQEASDWAGTQGREQKAQQQMRHMKKRGSKWQQGRVLGLPCGMPAKNVNASTFLQDPLGILVKLKRLPKVHKPNSIWSNFSLLTTNPLYFHLNTVNFKYYPKTVREI